MSGMGDGYVGTAEDVVRIRRLEKQREEFSSSTNEILETAFKKHQGAICSEETIVKQIKDAFEEFTIREHVAFVFIIQYPIWAVSIWRYIIVRIRSLRA